MFARTLLISTLSIVTFTPALALDTAALGPQHLRELGTHLEAGSGNNQWQQLWRSARTAGMFEPGGDQLQFAVSAAQLPDLARQTLGQADQVEPLPPTRARYRRSFEPLIIGHEQDQSYNALCLEVDWRAVPDGMRTTPEAYLGHASLSRVYPCH